MWGENEEYEKVISNSWQVCARVDDMHGIMKKISRCSENLGVWNKISFEKFHLNIKEG